MSRLCLAAFLIAVVSVRASGQNAAPLIPATDVDAVMKQFNAALGVR